MKQHAPQIFAATAVVLAAFASNAGAGSCSNTCATMAIARTSDGVITKLDGTADAALWPPDDDLRVIRISSINDRGFACDVDITDVQQNEPRAVAANGTPIDDAVGCANDGETSTIQLRAKRSNAGDGRSYHVDIAMKDPDCVSSSKADEVVVVVPRTEEEATLTAGLQPLDDQGALTASYSGGALQCSPRQDDRIARADTRR